MKIHQKQIRKIVFLLFIILINSCSQDKESINLLDNQIQPSEYKEKLSEPNEPTLIWAEDPFDNHPKRNLKIIDYDDDYQFVGRHYGDSKDRFENTKPAFFVHSKKFNRWLKIKQISTKNGIFGYSKKLSEEEKQKMRSCSVHLGQSHLANQKFCDLPLITSGSIAFPDNITLDTITNEYILVFFSSWEIEKVKTILRFKKADLDLKFEEIAKMSS